jgi:hypothetical protein
MVKVKVSRPTSFHAPGKNGRVLVLAVPKGEYKAGPFELEFSDDLEVAIRAAAKAKHPAFANGGVTIIEG